MVFVEMVENHHAVVKSKNTNRGQLPVRRGGALGQALDIAYRVVSRINRPRRRKKTRAKPGTLGARYWFQLFFKELKRVRMIYFFYAEFAK